MTTQRITSCIMIMVFLLIITNPTSAAALDCNSPTTAIEMAADNATCPKCLPCPPVTACKIGYSCQPDKSSPSNGKMQQYPPDAAAAWVISLGCEELSDVALDDQRWGVQEEGEVYIQESAKCISVYWPNGGEALFDLSATLSNPAKWNDYRFSQINGKPRSGNYTIGNGKERIHFTDGGTGGMTVFVAGAATPPPVSDGNQIQPYMANNAYWQYKGKPILLKGSSISNSLVDARMGQFYYHDSKNSDVNGGRAKHVTPDFLGWDESLCYGNGASGVANFESYKNAVREEFRLMREAGGNFIRLTLADYSGGWIKGGEDASLQPFMGKMSSHSYDLSKWNDEWWKRLDFVFAEAERNGIIIQLELWDGWDLGGDSTAFKNSVWHPDNNISYNTSSMKVKFKGRENSPYRKIWIDSDKAVVLKYAKKYINRVLDYIKPYGNIIVGIENENPASIPHWSNKWADFVQSNNPYSHNIYVTDMRDEYDPQGNSNTVIKNDTTRYQYLDLSQHSRRMNPDASKYDGFYNDISTFVNGLGNKKRPVNIAKIYSYHTPPNTWANNKGMEHGINYYWANIFAGTSGSRYHRPAQDIKFVSPKEARKDHKAATWMVNTAGDDFFSMEPYHYKDAFTGRDTDGLSYARKGSGKYVVYFDKWEKQISLKVLNGIYKVQWYNRDTSTIKNSYTKSVTNGFLKLHKDHGGIGINRGVIVISKEGVITPLPPPPPSTGFLTPYTNPEQEKVPSDGMYPFGQQMWLSGYSNSSSQLNRMHDAGFTMSGPHYQGCNADDSKIKVDKLKDYGMKTFFRLYTSSKGWSYHIEKMRTVEGRAYLKGRLKRCVDRVLNDPKLNNVIAAWYGRPDEPINRNSSPIAKVREYMQFVRDYISQNDPQKRPLFWSERGDSSASNMKGNAKYTAGIMKQNYLMYGNNYDYKEGDINERFLIGQWVREMLNADKSNSLPYTEKRRPIITTLSMYVDPIEAKYKTEEWLRKAITYDVYLSIAMGVHGINVYTWAHGESTNKIQEKLYLEVIGGFAKAGLQKVFLWGDVRNDVKMEITAGPKTFEWTKYRNTYTEPSIKFRNIQYGDNRYLLLVNSSKKVVRAKLSGFPVDQQPMRILDMMTNKWSQLGATATLRIQPLGVKMYKIARD